MNKNSGSVVNGMVLSKQRFWVKFCVCLASGSKLFEPICVLASWPEKKEFLCYFSYTWLPAVNPSRSAPWHLLPDDLDPMRDF